MACPGVRNSERYHSIAGWDQYFGYGRINASSAVRRVAAGLIPPEADIDTPQWFAIVDPDDGILTVSGRVAANRSTSYAYVVEVAPGIQPAENEFTRVTGVSDQRAAVAGPLAQISLPALAARLPHGVVGSATDAAGQPDPDRFTFTVRVRVTDVDGNVGEDRRTYFLHHDADLVGGHPLSLGSDGAASPVMADLDGDGIDDLIIATSDGQVHAFHGRDLSELPGWPVSTDAIEIHASAPAFGSGEIPVTISAAVLGTPAVGDLDHDGQLSVVAADVAGKLYVWGRDGVRRPGFPVSTMAVYSNSRRSERTLDTPDGQVPDRTNRHTADNRLARGFGAPPALGNLDGSPDGALDIIIGALDRHVYAWHADGSPVRGWPVLLKDPGKVQSVDPVSNEITLLPGAKASIGTKIITPVSLGDVDGDGMLDVVVGVNEEYSERPNAVFTNPTINLYRGAGVLNSGNGRTYALFHDGTAHGAAPLDHGWNPDAFLPGWPVKIAILQQGLLPTVGSGVNGAPVLADLDGDGRSEIAVFSFLGPVYVFNGLGQSFLGNTPSGVPRTLGIDVFGAQATAIDAPAVPSLGGGALAEMNGPHTGFQFLAPTAGLGKLVDANLPAHQTPSENQLGVWDVTLADGSVASGQLSAAFPRLVNDLQFLTAPAVADIDGDGLPEALEGSGVYDLHAFDIQGREPSGWPKLTGGWTTATAAVGDIDGDGHLEVVTVTREGWLFVWKTTAAECSGTPWRKNHHDAWNTSNYAVDARAPAPLRTQDTSVSSAAGGAVTLGLQAVPGDDLYCGAPARFDLRYAAEPIITAADFAAATRFEIRGQPEQPGRSRSGSLQLQAPTSFAPGRFYLAAQVLDAAGNRSPFTALGPVTLLAAATSTSTISPTPLPTPTTTAVRTVTPSPTPTKTASSTPRPVADADGGCAVDPGASGSFAWGLMASACLVALRRRRAASERGADPASR